MTTQLIATQYGDMPVIFQSDAFINATAIAKQFNKQPRDYLKTEQTVSYIDAIKRIFLIDENQIVKVKKGSTENGGGTWLHPKLAIDFARWLSADFAVWCDMQIEKILHPVITQQSIPEKPTKKALTGGLTLDQQDSIKALVKARVEVLPKDKQAKAAITCWSSLKSKFGKTYKEIEPAEFTSALSLVARLPLEGELLPKPEENLNSDILNFEGLLNRNDLMIVRTSVLSGFIDSVSGLVNSAKAEETRHKNLIAELSKK